jgi:hypothetical protein
MMQVSEHVRGPVELVAEVLALLLSLRVSASLVLAVGVIS